MKRRIGSWGYNMHDGMLKMSDREEKTKEEG